MRLWRLTKMKHVAAALDGEGARLVGGRWNSAGRRAVYLSEHLSLAALEVLVHANKANLPEHAAIALEVPNDLAVHAPSLSELPSNWRDRDAPQSTREFGDAWLERGTEALLRVPSVVVPDEANYLLNPIHPDAARIVRQTVASFQFDPRLLKV
jgi:RES domain-containing protein